MNAALHVQHKKQDTFDVENRVIPLNVMAYSTDTGDLRFGDGRSRWRYLDQYHAAGGEALDPSDLEKDSMYSGPLHTLVLSEDETEERGPFVPSSNVLVVRGVSGFSIGDGVRPLSDLPLFAPSEEGQS